MNIIISTMNLIIDGKAGHVYIFLDSLAIIVP